MITDLPTSLDFQHAGLGFLNYSWDAAIELVRMGIYIGDPDNWRDGSELRMSAVFDVTNPDVADFWQSAQRHLATALALTQQGIELLLKAKISEVSPYLLLEGSWCKVPERDTAFADFRTIDSQDLIRVHNIVQSKRLPDDFKNRVNDLRQKRNKVFHSVDNRFEVTAKEVMFSIMDAVHHLVGERKWVSIRREAIESCPLTSMDNDSLDGTLAQEFAMVIKPFSPVDVHRFLGLKERGRRYLCYHCHRSSRDFDQMPDCRFAILNPNSSKSTSLYCFVCDEETRVKRTACRSEYCPGNVIEAEDRVCMTCGEDQSGPR